MVEVARMSPITGKVNKMLLPITAEDWTYWLKGQLIDRIRDKLTPEELEFVTTGIYPGDR